MNIGSVTPAAAPIATTPSEKAGHLAALRALQKALEAAAEPAPERSEAFEEKGRLLDIRC